MNAQLLLLLALVGSFCAFTHANPTPLPTQLDDIITEDITHGLPDATEAPKEELTVFTGPPSTAVAAAPEELATVAVTAAHSAPEPSPANTEEPAVETEAPAVAATAAAEVTEAGPEPEVPHTDPPAVVTAAPTVAAKTEEEPVATAGAKMEEGADGEVLVEDEGLTSGQVVGIVIGALLAVIIVIAVVIAVVRRMGKYSP